MFYEVYTRKTRGPGSKLELWTLEYFEILRSDKTPPGCTEDVTVLDSSVEEGVGARSAHTCMEDIPMPSTFKGFTHKCSIWVDGAPTVENLERWKKATKCKILENLELCDDPHIFQKVLNNLSL